MHAIVNGVLMVHRGWSEEMRYYERIDGSKYRNIWVVGDLQWMLHEPDEQNWIRLDLTTKKDPFISVGDLVDRGTENVECPELITFPGSELYVETMST